MVTCENTEIRVAPAWPYSAKTGIYIFFMKKTALTLFVYGTLQPRGRYWPAFCAGGRAFVRVPEAWVPGTLYALPQGYPALVRGKGRVYGMVLVLRDDAILASIDALEAYAPWRPPDENEYQREWVSWFYPEGQAGGKAWRYRMDAERARAMGGHLISSGRWLAPA